MEPVMKRAFEHFPLRQPARSASFLGRRRQQDALYRTIPGATYRGAARRREATPAADAKAADGGAQILTYPGARRTPDTL
jgi:hypothetical protein